MADPLARIRDAADGAGIFLDFDGTLSPIVTRPQEAGPAPGAVGVLEALVPRYRLVAVISGRPTEVLVDLIGVRGIRYEGMYGLAAATGIDALRERVEAVARTVPGAWVEPKSATISVHYRQTDDPPRAREVLLPPLRSLADETGYELFEGKMVLELAPAGESRKGGAVARLVREADLDAALYAGDDLPDLEAFAVLDELARDGLRVMKIAVGGPELPEGLAAAADLVVEDPSALVGALRSLV